MSGQQAEDLMESYDAQINDALVIHCGISRTDVARINEAMSNQGLSFIDAALKLELATREDIDDVTSWIRDRVDGGIPRGVIETAIRGQQSTALTVRRSTVRPSRQLGYLSDSNDERSEKLRALRTELMLLNSSSRRGNMIALLSPGRGEGRSHLCAELAISFAQLGRPTLLIDADLRHPRQHVLFNAENTWGLAQALSLGEPPYLYGVEGLPDLTLMTSGPVPPNPLELISNRRFEQLLQALKMQYDFIVVDTPAVSQSADGVQIATLAERVLVVSRTENTSIASMKNMLRRLAVSEAKILGAVINKF